MESNTGLFALWASAKASSVHGRQLMSVIPGFVSVQYEVNFDGQGGHSAGKKALWKSVTTSAVYTRTPSPGNLPPGG